MASLCEHFDKCSIFFFYLLSFKFATLHHGVNRDMCLTNAPLNIVITSTASYHILLYYVILLTCFGFVELPSVHAPEYSHISVRPALKVF